MIQQKGSPSQGLPHLKREKFPQVSQWWDKPRVINHNPVLKKTAVGMQRFFLGSVSPFFATMALFKTRSLFPLFVVCLFNGFLERMILGKKELEASPRKQDVSFQRVRPPKASRNPSSTAASPLAARAALRRSAFRSAFRRSTGAEFSSASTVPNRRASTRVQKPRCAPTSSTTWRTRKIGGGKKKVVVVFLAVLLTSLFLCAGVCRKYKDKTA